MYKFEEYVVLFLDIKEFKVGKVNEDFIKRNNLIVGDLNEGIVTIYIKGEEITIPFILELEDILDSRITRRKRIIRRIR